MKTLILSLLLVSFAVTLVSAGWVKGYMKKDGTYVEPYYRTNPNDYKWDNKDFNKWDSPYQTDWYNKSYFDKNYGSGYYDQLKASEDQLKQMDRESRSYDNSRSYDYQPPSYYQPTTPNYQPTTPNYQPTTPNYNYYNNGRDNSTDQGGYDNNNSGDNQTDSDDSGE